MDKNKLALSQLCKAQTNDTEPFLSASPALDKENVNTNRNKNAAKLSRLTTLRRTLGGKALSCTESDQAVRETALQTKALLPNNNLQQQQQTTTRPTRKAESFTARRVNRKLATVSNPKTPKTMLRFEMEAVSSGCDESLLVSPMENFHAPRSTVDHSSTPRPEAKEPPTESTTTSTSPTIQELEDHAQSFTQDIAMLDIYLQSSTKPTNEPLNLAWEDINITVANCGAMASDAIALQSPADELSQTQQVLSQQWSDEILCDSNRRVSSKQKPTTGMNNLDGQGRRTETKNGIDTPTPILTRGTGVQMDLSEIFRHATSPSIPASIVSGGKSANDNETLPIVSVSNPRKDLWLDFGHRNMVGKVHSMSFYLEAPDESEDCIVHIEKVPVKKGFDIDAWNINDERAKVEDKPMVRIEQGKRKLLQVSWVPKEAGGVRETIMLKLPRGRLQVVCHGHAQPAPSIKVGGAQQNIVQQNYHIVHILSFLSVLQLKKSKPAISSRIEIARVKNIETMLTKENELSLAKSLPPIPVRVASPAASKNVATFNEVDAEKQCAAFTEWLNYTFQPTEDRDHESSHHEAELYKSDNRMALRTLILHRRAAQARSKANEVFRSQEMQSVKVALESEVSRGRLSIRSDRDMHADLNLRAEVIELLLSYSTPWLRIGLETIFNETISAEIPSLLSPKKDYTQTSKRAKVRLIVVVSTFSSKASLYSLALESGTNWADEADFEELHNQSRHI
jgi:hypothetical protein